MNFYKKLLEKTDSQVLYLIPIWKGEVLSDFKINFSTGNLKQMLNLDSAEVSGKLMSDIFPEYLENGIFEILVASYKKKDLQIDFERLLYQSSKPKWFSFTAERFDEGVCLTGRDISRLKKAQKHLKDANEELSIQLQALNEAEKIGKSANFRWSVKQNQWDYSGNFFELLPTTSFTNTSSSFFDLLSKEDSRRIQDHIVATDYYGSLEKQFFSIQDQHRTKHFSLSGHFAPKKEGQIMIGVIKDITSELEREQDLKHKNEELEYSNRELDSFNHIASHDLQEPLRKVQMFISRLSSTDRKNLSQKGATYIEKIASATERMQGLIQHLLTYSRIGKKQAAVELINLNEVIDNVIEDIKDGQEDLFDIHIETLPNIEGIPFLLEQLFVNILSNAVKYKSLERDLNVKIYSNLKKRDLLQNIKRSLSDHIEVVVIKIEDNGIGFDNEFASKIFEPFQRLHQKDEYEGTGIGLAICEKIVQAHDGVITAQGLKGQGSIITIELPLKFQNEMN